MPSLKMKTKSTTSCVRGKNGLGICQKSSMICKNSCSRVRISQAAADFDACIHIGQDGSNEYFEVQLSGAGINKDLDASLLGADDSDDNSRSSCEYQTCHVSDFHFSDMIVPGSDDNRRRSCEYQTCSISDCRISDIFVADLPIESNSVCEDISDATCLPDYECDQSSMLFDLAEEYMILPFLEDTMQASSNNDDRTCEDIIIDSDDSSLYIAIHQLRSCNQEDDANPYLDLDQSDGFDPHMFIRNLPELPDAAENFLPAVLPKEMQKQNSITLVLDLDETLVHSTLEHCDDADFTFPVFFNMKEHTVYVKQRPYLRMFLERVAEMFEIVVFTASQSIYAEQLLDILDPVGNLISRRVYRESCIILDGSYTKDLTVLGVDLAKVTIIDNSPQVFKLQVNNGIPIKSWFDDSSDCALISLLPFLETLVGADDVRPIIAKRFGNKE
ncbi:CTD small phosphatase-like protein [Actinidia chinensis var. chinensis]|uniref:CTD small phosphatase-like protein n=1 Tax=Actinidia chinensis var. chinensis TaxID=1590841 RepID=A0A2R6RG63_ACTCC|nr:CTD small phosphatase-like protein [Actinidia chinensis var. chinensis]